MGLQVWPFSSALIVLVASHADHLQAFSLPVQLETLSVEDVGEKVFKLDKVISCCTRLKEHVAPLRDNSFNWLQALSLGPGLFGSLGNLRAISQPC